MIRRLYLGCCILASCLVAGQSTTYALLGKTVKLDPGLTAPADDILWKHNRNKVVDFNTNEERVYGTFENRITLDWVSAELSISDLRYEDSGAYELEAYVKRELKRSSFKLEVIDRVAQPTISCEMNNGNSSIKTGNQATLKCSVEQSPALMKFKWTSHGNVQLGEQLIISLGDKHDDEVYSCTVSNPLTKESTTFTAKECYPAEGSAGLIAGVCVAVAISVILGILGVMFCKLKKKACFANEKRADVENQASPPGSEHKGAERDERKQLLYRESTLASRQPLRFLNQSDINAQNNHTEDPDSDQDNRRVSVRERVNRFDPNSKYREEKEKQAETPHLLDPTENGRGDAAFEELKEPPEKEHVPSDSANDLSGVSDDQSENKSDLQSPTAFEEPEAEKEADEKATSPANGIPPAALPCFPLTESSNASPQEGAGEQEEKASFDQHTGDTAEKNVEESDISEPEKGNESEDVNDKTGPEKNTEKEKPTVAPRPLSLARSDKEDAVDGPCRELPENEDCDPPDSQKTNDDLSGESDNQSENPKPDPQSSTASQHPGPEKNTEKKKPPVAPRPPSLARNDKEHTDDEPPPDSQKTNDLSGESDNQESKKEEGESEEATCAPANDVFHPVESPNTAPQDGAGEQDKDASSDKDTAETTEKNVGGSDSFSSKEENQSEDGEKVAETTDEPNITPKETHPGGDNQQESSKVSEDNSESDSASDQDKIDQNKSIPPDSSQQPHDAKTRQQ